MKGFTKYLAGAAGAAALTLTAAAPAQAQTWDRHRDRGGIDAGDVITGVAVIGGIAAILSALSRDGNRYSQPVRAQYRNHYSGAVNACAYQAQRAFNGGQVSVTDVDQRGNGRYQVHGVIDAGYGFGGQSRFGGFDRFDRRTQRVAFECTARADGRITRFDIS